MNIDTIPIWITFVVTVISVVLAVRAGFTLGHRVRQKSAEDEKESPAAAMAAAILTLAGFMLTFTFGISFDRLNDRKTLVRDEANAIRTAWLRSDFLPEPDRAEAKGLLRKYVDIRLDVVKADEADDLDQEQKALRESNRIHRQIWDTAVKNARKDMNSDVAALYIESINEFINIQALRVAVALYPQIPEVIWVVLYVLVILGMMSIGFQTAITGSARRSHSVWLLAVSFSVVITLIAVLDRPKSDVILVPQEPLIDLRGKMAANLGTWPDLGHRS
jgi:hypothetical protein